MKILIILLLLLASTAFAQPPRIDSMVVDEIKGDLQVFGAFGNTTGKITINAIPLPIVHWTDSIIIASIQDTGAATAGAVVVQDSVGLQSNTRTLSMFTNYWYDNHWEQHSRPYERNNSFKLVSRLDIHSILKNKSFGKRSFIPFKLTSLYKYCENACGTPSINIGSGYIEHTIISGRVFLADTSISYMVGLACNVIFDPMRRTFDYTVSQIKGFKMDVQVNSTNFFDTSIDVSVDDFSGTFSMDFMYRPDSSTYTNNTQFVRIGSGYGGSFSYPPPARVMTLLNQIRLTAPEKDRSDIGTANVVLVWDSLLSIDAYHLQLFTDSGLSLKMLDTIVSPTSYTFPSLSKLTKYYWRVSGINSEGESRWSDIWDFMTSATSTVKEDEEKGSLLLCYPNPASNELTISYSLAKPESTKIVLYDLRGNIIKSVIASEHTTRLSTEHLPNGIYILAIITASERLSKVITIVH